MTAMAHRQWHFAFLQYEVVSVDTHALFLAVLRGLEPGAPPPAICAMPAESPNFFPSESSAVLLPF
jgi:hypothetical protein